MKYRKRPVIIDAVQLPVKDLPPWLVDSPDVFWYPDRCTAIVKTPESRNMVFEGGWIMRDSRGRLRVCGAEEFAATYEEIDEG